MFIDNNSYRKITLKHIFNMHEHCPICTQQYDLEPGFWYGTAYVSYALAVAVSVATFIAWLVLIGVGINDNRIFYWLIMNAVLLVVLQPWMMRMSRVIYIRFFVRYDPHYTRTKPVEFKDWD
jgi:hypothetical protein